MVGALHLRREKQLIAARIELEEAETPQEFMPSSESY